MFKDYNKYLKESLKVYTFLLVIIFIMKIVGLNYFGLTTDNIVLNKISHFLGNTHFGDLFSFTMIYLQFYFYLCVVCKRAKLYKFSLIGAILNYITQIILMNFFKMNWIYQIVCLLISILLPMIVEKKFFIKRQIKYIVLINVYQLISLFIRNVGVNSNYGNFLIDNLLALDQILLLAITYNLYFLEGGIRLCGEALVVGSSLLKKINLSTLLKRLQRNLHNFKALDKETKLTCIIYFILSLIWNTLTIIIILLVARLNGTIIECLFILTSFWLSKHTFGRPFHLPSMKQCFIISNLTYYILNRITTPLGISILLPIMLGVGLSYITSKLAKKIYKPLYKGMPNNLFEETILKITDKDSLEYKICYDYYVLNKSALQVSNRYNYTYDGVKKIFKRINDKIKEL